MEAADLLAPCFQDDTYFLSHLKSSQQKALQELKDKLEDSQGSTEEYSMWSIPLLGGGVQADVILLKFLIARDFRVHESFLMLTECLKWREEFGADGLVGEDLGFGDLEGVVAYMHGVDRVGHPVCYNYYGYFRDKEKFERYFGDYKNRKRFLRWRVQVLERGINDLHFKPGCVNSIIQVIDLKDMPRRKLTFASNQILSLFEDNYPEMVARKIFINVPWYFSVLYSMFSPFLTQRIKSKHVISKEGNVAETLFKFIKPENVPVKYGGLSRPSDLQNDPPAPVYEFTVKGGETVNIPIEGIEAGATITWEMVVGGWDLEYRAEFVPNAEGSITTTVEMRKISSSAEDIIRKSFTSTKAGKMVFSVNNTASSRRKVGAYRYIVCREEEKKEVEKKKKKEKKLKRAAVAANESCDVAAAADEALLKDEYIFRQIKEPADESCEGGKKLNQMVPIHHVPKINGEIPTTDEEISDHQRLLDRLQLYDLVENIVQGDGNCQFCAVSDQLFRSPDHHKDVREQVVQQLKSHPEMYGGYVPMRYDDYLKKMSKSGEWGDHVTLQAAADWFGVKIFMITSFKDTCYIEIIPHVQKSKRVILLSFWAEVRYNSIYQLEAIIKEEEEEKKKKKKEEEEKLKRAAVAADESCDVVELCSDAAEEEKEEEEKKEKKKKKEKKLKRAAVATDESGDMFSGCT